MAVVLVFLYTHVQTSLVVATTKEQYHVVHACQVKTAMCRLTVLCMWVRIFSFSQICE